MRAKTFGVIVRLLILIGILAAFLYYLYNNSEKYQELLEISKTSVIYLFTLSLAFPLLNSMQNTYLYRELGLENFSHLNGFLITSASTLANQLPIPGGIVSRGYYLKRLHNLSYTKYTSSAAALFFCYVAVNGLIGVGVLLYWTLTDRTVAPPILLIAFIVMVASLSVFWLPLNRIRMPERIQRWKHQIIDGWTAIGRNPRLLFQLTALQVILVVLLSLRYWIAFHMLSQNVTIGQTMLFASASILTQLVSVAPGGLGVREAIVTAVATTLGFDPGVSFVAVGLDRLVITVVIVITGWISTLILGKQISNRTIEPV